MRGLGYRVGYSGTRTFHVMTRAHWRQVLQVIGPYPATKLKDAREEAGEIIRQARKGVDPREKRRQAPQEAERAQRDTFAAVAEVFIAEDQKENRRLAEVDRTLRVNVTPARGKRSIASITQDDVKDFLKTIAKERGPYMSNRTRSAVRRLFAWAVQENKIGANPVANVKPVLKKEVSRERVLEAHELRAFWQATAGDDHPWAPFLRTLLLTAQRRGETSMMRWQDLDLDGDEPVWSIPREFVKANRTHDVTLAPEVVVLLKDLPRHEGPHVFTTGDGTAPISGFTLAKRRLDQKMGEIMREAALEAGDDPEKVEIEPWRLHDLRRLAWRHSQFSLWCSLAC